MTIENSAFLPKYMHAEINGGSTLFDWKLQQSPVQTFSWKPEMVDIVFYLPVIEDIQFNNLFKSVELYLLDALTGIRNTLTYNIYKGAELTNDIVLDEGYEPIEDKRGKKYYYAKIKFLFDIPNNFGTDIKEWSLGWQLRMSGIIINSTMAEPTSDYVIRIDQVPQSYEIETANFYIGTGVQPYPAEKPTSCSSKPIAGFNNIKEESIIVNPPKIDGAPIEECGTSFYSIDSFGDNSGLIYATINIPTNPTNVNRKIEFDIFGVSVVTGNVIKYTSVLTQHPNIIAEGVVAPKYIEIDYLEQSYEIELQWDKDNKRLYEVEIENNAPWIDVPATSEYMNNTMKVPFTITENPYRTTRNAVLKIGFKNIGGGDFISYVYIQINQSKNVDYGVMSTWQTKKIEINFDEKDQKQTKKVDILIGDNIENAVIIYSNLVYNTGVTNYIDITEIINNNIDADVDFTLSDEHQVDSTELVKVYRADNQYKRIFIYADGELIYVSDICYNYMFDYVPDYSPNRLLLNRNVFNEIDPRQLIFSSVYADKNGTNLGTDGIHTDGIRLRIKNGTAPIYRATELCMPGGIYHGIIKPLSTDGNFLVAWEAQDRHLQRADEYKVVCPDLHKYAIYYVNMYGGIDFLLGTNASTETVTVKNSSITKYADNNTRTEFGKYNYLKENVTSWKIVTDMFYGTKKYKEGDTTQSDYYNTDEQAQLMQHLFQSPKIWLHDLEKDIIYSAVLTDSKMTNKTFMTNGNKHFNYTLNLERSQTDIIM